MASNMAGLAVCFSPGQALLHHLSTDPSVHPSHPTIRLAELARVQGGRQDTELSQWESKRVNTGLTETFFPEKCCVKIIISESHVGYFLTFYKI